MAPRVDINEIADNAIAIVEQWRDLLIGTEDIERLRDEATKAGNHAKAAACSIALAGIYNILEG